MNTSIFKSLIIPILIIMLSGTNELIAQDAQQTSATTAPSIWGSALFVVMLSLIVLLLFAIVAVSGAISGVVESEKRKNISRVTLIVILSMPFEVLYSNTVSSSVGFSPVGDMDGVLFYVMLTVIIAELIILLLMFNNIKGLLRSFGHIEEKDANKGLIDWQVWEKRLNDSVPVEQEAEVMTDHEYDGIRELDNSLPPWWRYLFYLSIIFSFVYVLHYHVFKTGLSQEAELKVALDQGELQKQEYLKKTADNVDENTVVLLSNESDIATGKKIYVEFCAACHGQAGEGSVGPNLTDNYWLHGGGIKDIFKTIKYGVPQKGMIAWQEQLKPKDIQSVASFIYGIRGTNPPNPKAPDGQLYAVGTMEARVIDTLKTDSILK